MQTKICVLVTHQLQYLKDIKHILLMDTGLISAHDSYQNIITNENSIISRSTSFISEKGGTGDETISEDILVRIKSYNYKKKIIYSRKIQFSMFL